MMNKVGTVPTREAVDSEYQAFLFSADAQESSPISLQKSDISRDYGVGISTSLLVQGDGSPLRAPLQQRLRQDNFSGLIKKSQESLRPTLLTTEEKPGKR